jgi:hypothetical protein
VLPRTQSSRKHAISTSSHAVMLTSLRQLFAPFIRFMEHPPRPDIPHLFPSGEYTVPVTTWAASIRHLDGVEGCLLSAVLHYKCEKDKQHEFLVVFIRHPSDAITVLCTDRSPKPVERSSPSSGEKLDGVSLLSSARLPANDRVMVSRDGTEKTITERFKPFKLLRSLRFQDQAGPTVSQFAVLLDVVNAHAPEYELYKSQCYWFAGVTYDTLKDLFDSQEDSTTLSKLQRSSYLGLPITQAESSSAIKREYHTRWSVVETAIVKKQQDRKEQVEQVQLCCVW